jgi:hypothetical protein
MECKLGYGGPLCALCSDGYFKSVRDCALCERVRIGELAALLFGALALIALLMFLARKYHRYLDRAAAFSRECCMISISTERASHLQTKLKAIYNTGFSCFSFHHLLPGFSFPSQI